MSNTDVEALKELYEKLGGEDNVAAINTSSEMINKIAEVATSGGGSDEGGSSGPWVSSNGENSAILNGTIATAYGKNSIAIGNGTRASGKGQFVFGEHNVLDNEISSDDGRGRYVEIVGNGTAADETSNARTLDWSGNEWVYGTVEACGGVILRSPNRTRYLVTVSNDGTLTATKIIG